MEQIYEKSPKHIVLGYCNDCDRSFVDDGLMNSCYCPKCGGSNYVFETYCKENSNEEKKDINTFLSKETISRIRKRLAKKTCESCLYNIEKYKNKTICDKCHNTLKQNYIRNNWWNRNIAIFLKR